MVDHLLGRTQIEVPGEKHDKAIQLIGDIKRRLDCTSDEEFKASSLLLEYQHAARIIALGNGEPYGNVLVIKNSGTITFYNSADKTTTIGVSDTDGESILIIKTSTYSMVESGDKTVAEKDISEAGPDDLEAIRRVLRVGCECLLSSDDVGSVRGTYGYDEDTQPPDSHKLTSLCRQPFERLSDFLYQDNCVVNKRNIAEISKSISAIVAMFGRLEEEDGKVVPTLHFYDIAEYYYQDYDVDNAGITFRLHPCYVSVHIKSENSYLRIPLTDEDYDTNPQNTLGYIVSGEVKPHPFDNKYAKQEYEYLLTHSISELLEYVNFSLLTEDYFS